jgi:L-serine deaminase
MKAPGGVSQEEVLVEMVEIVRIIQKSIREGLKGTSYEDRILGFQSGKYLDGVESGLLMDLGVLDTIIPYVTALMEVKSSMGVVAAAPSAGSCGGVPGFDPVVPFDEVVQALNIVGRSIPANLRCTALGGLSVTDTSKRITGTLLNQC